MYNKQVPYEVPISAASLMAPGLDAETSALASRLLRIMFPMIIFTGAAYTLVGVMQTKGRYFLPSMISAVSNAGIIIYLLAIDPLVGEGGVYGLAIAYLCAWFLQFLTLALPLYRSGFKFSPRLDFKNRALREALKKLPPIMEMDCPMARGRWIPASCKSSKAISRPSTSPVTVKGTGFGVLMMVFSRSGGIHWG